MAIYTENTKEPCAGGGLRWKLGRDHFEFVSQGGGNSNKAHAHLRSIFTASAPAAILPTPHTEPSKI